MTLSTALARCPALPVATARGEIERGGYNADDSA